MTVTLYVPEAGAVQVLDAVMVSKVLKPPPPLPAFRIMSTKGGLDIVHPPAD
ncbi:MAG: hypothetical protein LBO66_07765 [Deltaproteobacteria bacterium]|jgi:hypothetical protein|nr:hypothetical protein [Deltaproteobacteria bacterium]